MFPLETLPPRGDPSGGVVYLRIVLPPEQASRMWVFLNINVLQGGFVSTSPNPQAGGPPLDGCPRMLIQYIRSLVVFRAESLVFNTLRLCKVKFTLEQATKAQNGSRIIALLFL